MERPLWGRKLLFLKTEKTGGVIKSPLGSIDIRVNIRVTYNCVNCFRWIIKKKINYWRDSTVRPFSYSLFKESERYVFPFNYWIFCSCVEIPFFNEV